MLLLEALLVDASIVICKVGVRPDSNKVSNFRFWIFCASTQSDRWVQAFYKRPFVRNSES